MRIPFLIPLILAVPFECLHSQDAPSKIVLTQTDGTMEDSFRVRIPAGDSDFFNTRYDLDVGTPFAGLVVGLTDTGASEWFPRVGLYEPNYSLDVSGNTPDLGAAIVEVQDFDGLGGHPHDHVYVEAPGVTTTGTCHVVIQFPPGDFGNLGISADTDTLAQDGGESPGFPNPHDASGFSFDAYRQPARSFPLGDFALAIALSPTALVDGSTDLLRLTNHRDDLVGDFVTMTTEAHRDFGVTVMAQERTDATHWARLFVSEGSNPLQAIGGPIPLLDRENGVAYTRLVGTWPRSLGNTTMQLVAITGVQGVPGSVKTTNEVTVHTLVDPPPDWGSLDDCTYEAAWQVQGPAGSSDFFNVNFGDPARAGVALIESLQVAVWDIGTQALAYPSSGVAPAHVTLDPSGNTPDLSNPYDVAPFLFPPLVTVSRCEDLIFRQFDPPIAVDGTMSATHAFIQFPLGDDHLLGIAADSDGVIHLRSGLTEDAYTTPAGIFDRANWGLRLGHTP